jgi:hypothetical protein
MYYYLPAKVSQYKYATTLYRCVASHTDFLSFVALPTAAPGHPLTKHSTFAMSGIRPETDTAGLAFVGFDPW